MGETTCGRRQAWVAMLGLAGALLGTVHATADENPSFRIAEGMRGGKAHTWTLASQRVADQVAWEGTINVSVAASGIFQVPGQSRGIGFVANQRTTITLNGDGTATWTSEFSRTVDMGGLYTIPASGRGAGVGFAGATFEGTSWNVFTELTGNVPLQEDFSAQDRFIAFESPFAFMTEIAKGMGIPVVLENRIEAASVDVFGLEADSQGGVNAATLSGRLTRVVPDGAQALGGPILIPATYTADWNLTRAQARPAVTIYGPGCGCIETGQTERTLSFVAGASPLGGEFSEFIVTADGALPEVIVNSGGDRPALELVGTKSTGTITLGIRYRRNGQIIESAPFTVEFCALDAITLADGDDIAFDAAGVLTVRASASAWRAGQDVSPDLEWDVDEMGSPTRLSVDPVDKRGPEVMFTYNGLPRRNMDFGPKKISVRTTGRCECEGAATFRAFFSGRDSNHPGDGSPNWFYYWKQSAAVPAEARDILRFVEKVDVGELPGSPIAKYDQSTQEILVSAGIFERDACRHEVDAEGVASGRRAQGIDCFGETIRHELQHRKDALDWWGTHAGPFGVNLFVWFAKDFDHDLVPNTVEEARPGCQPGEISDIMSGYRATWFSCSERPFKDVPDNEINSYRHGWTWPIGSADREDWSCGELSKQWRGKRCGS